MSAHLAHRNDPDTSHDAATRVGEFRHQHHQIILDVLYDAPNGLTAHEVADRSPLEMVQVNRRLHELGNANTIVRTDERRQTPSGRTACVWQIKQPRQFSFEGIE